MEHPGTSKSCCYFKMLMLRSTRPSANKAKDWLDQLFLIPGLFWSGKGYHLWMSSLRGSEQPFFLCIRPFWAWWQPKDNWVILVQACS